MEDDHGEEWGSRHGKRAPLSRDRVVGVRPRRSVPIRAGRCWSRPSGGTASPWQSSKPISTCARSTITIAGLTRRHTQTGIGLRSPQRRDNRSPLGEARLAGWERARLSGRRKLHLRPGLGKHHGASPGNLLQRPMHANRGRHRRQIGEEDGDRIRWQRQSDFRLEWKVSYVQPIGSIQCVGREADHRSVRHTFFRWRNRCSNFAGA
jgi:hypothetical protein